jgi:hypothetical protein
VTLMPKEEVNINVGICPHKAGAAESELWVYSENFRCKTIYQCLTGICEVDCKPDKIELPTLPAGMGFEWIGVVSNCGKVPIRIVDVTCSDSKLLSRISVKVMRSGESIKPSSKKNVGWKAIRTHLRHLVLSEKDGADLYNPTNSSIYQLDSVQEPSSIDMSTDNTKYTDSDATWVTLADYLGHEYSEPPRQMIGASICVHACMLCL